MTLSLPSLILTCAPVCKGISPPLSIMRPVLVSRAEILAISAASAGLGPAIGFADVTIYMKRIDISCLRPQELSCYSRRRSGGGRIDSAFKIFSKGERLVEVPTPAWCCSDQVTPDEVGTTGPRAEVGMVILSHMFRCRQRSRYRLCRWRRRIVVATALMRLRVTCAAAATASP